MAAAKRVKDYFEPWRAQASVSWKAAFGESPPPVDDPAVADRWESARLRAERDAEWIVWGDGMFEPSVAWDSTGTPRTMHGDHVITRIRPVHTEAEGGPSQGEIARRIAECVNACEGLADPAALITAARDVLLGLAKGEIDAADPRVLSLSARLVPNKRPRRYNSVVPTETP